MGDQSVYGRPVTNGQSAGWPPKDDEATPVLTGDEAARMIAQLHAIGIAKGYRRVRVDRGQHPDSKDYYELGYSLGEIAVRFSHQPNLLLRHDDNQSILRFETALGINARFAYEEAGR